MQENVYHQNCAEILHKNVLNSELACRVICTSFLLNYGSLDASPSSVESIETQQEQNSGPSATDESLKITNF